jgi:hypothetical protein
MQVQQQSAPQQREEGCERERKRNRARRGQLGTYLFLQPAPPTKEKSRGREREREERWIWTMARRERREEVGWRRAGKVKIRITADEPVGGGRVDSGRAAQSIDRTRASRRRDE